MRLCRYQRDRTIEVAIYENDRIISINRVGVGMHDYHTSPVSIRRVFRNLAKG